MHRTIAAIAASALAGAACASIVALSPALGAPHAAAQPSPEVSVTTLPQLPTEPPVEPTYAPVATAPPATAIPGSIVAPAGAVIQIVGDIQYPRVITLKDLEHMQHTSLTMRVVDPDGKRRLHIFTGVLLRDLVNQAVPTAPGGSTASTSAYALVEGANGDSAIVAFPEFEARFDNKQILVAYEIDGSPLSGQNIGELVVPEDQTNGRFIVGIATIRIGSPSP